MYTSQIMTSKTPMRTIEDVDVVALNYAEIKGIASGNPKIREKTELDVKIASLKLLRQDYLSNKYQLQDKLVKFYPVGISTSNDNIINNHKIKIDDSNMKKINKNTEMIFQH